MHLQDSIRLMPYDHKAVCNQETAATPAMDIWISYGFHTVWISSESNGEMMGIWWWSLDIELILYATRTRGKLHLLWPVGRSPDLSSNPQLAGSMLVGMVYLIYLPKIHHPGPPPSTWTGLVSLPLFGSLPASCHPPLGSSTLVWWRSLGIIVPKRPRKAPKTLKASQILLTYVWNISYKC